MVSFKTGRKPLFLSPMPVVTSVINILGAFAKATDELAYPEGASTTEKDIIFCEKIGTLARGHKILTAESLKSTNEYLEASVKYAYDCRVAGDDAIEKAGELIDRDLTTEEMTFFEKMDAMNAEELSVVKSIIDLFTVKMRASFDCNDTVHPENANNETMLMIVKHITKQGVAKPTSRFTSKKRPLEKKSARYSMGATSCDSQLADDYFDDKEETPSPPEPTYTFSTKISSTEPFLISSTAGTSKSSTTTPKNSSIEPFLISSSTGTSKSSTTL